MPKIDRPAPRALAVKSESLKSPKSPAKPAAPPPPAKQGWGATGAAKVSKLGGASGAGQVKLLSATIGDLPVNPKGLPAPKGYQPVLTDDKRSDSLALADGRTAKFDFNASILSVKGPDGKTMILAGKDEPNFESYQKDFRGNFEGATREDLQYQPAAEWDAQRGFSGFGTAGKLMSVVDSVSDYTGGAHPNNATTLRTFDLATGKPAKLDELVSKEQFASIVNAVKTSLPKLKGEDGIEGTSFTPYGDLAKQVAENFAVSTDKNGKTQITVGWESGIHALGGQMASFTFAAPEDAAFKARLGGD